MGESGVISVDDLVHWGASEILAQKRADLDGRARVAEPLMPTSGRRCVVGVEIDLADDEWMRCRVQQTWLSRIRELYARTTAEQGPPELADMPRRFAFALGAEPNGRNAVWSHQFFSSGTPLAKMMHDLNSESYSACTLNGSALSEAALHNPWPPRAVNLARTVLHAAIESYLSVEDWIRRMRNQAWASQPKPSARKRAANNDTVHVYVMASDDLCKVGISTDPERRCAEVRTAGGRDVRLVWSALVGARNHARWVERTAHEMLSETRAHGEWFRATPDTATRVVTDAISECKRAGGAR